MSFPISIIYLTARLGSMDMLFGFVAHQTFPDFELIIVDHFYEERRQTVELMRRHRFPNIKHVSPNLKSDVYANSAGWNCGLRLAEGELAIHIVDFVWLPPDFLERHWNFYKKNPGHSLSVFVDRYKYPPFGDLSHEERCTLSIFQEWFDEGFAERWFVPENLIYQERKGAKPEDLVAGNYYEIPGEKIYLLGDSIPLRVMKELNGWDMIYNGGYGSNDIDIGVRANLASWKFVLDPSAPTLKKLGDKSIAHLLPTAPTVYTKSPEENYELFLQRIAAIKEGKESVAVPEGRGAW